MKLEEAIASIPSGGIITRQAWVEENKIEYYNAWPVDNGLSLTFAHGRQTGITGSSGYVSLNQVMSSQNRSYTDWEIISRDWLNLYVSFLADLPRH